MMPASNATSGQSIGFPDVCLTPAAPSPVPVPYPNIAANATSVGFVPTLLMNMMPALHMMTKTTMTSGMEAGAAHPMFKQMGGYTMGQPTILYNGIPAVSLLSPTNGNMYNNPVGAKLVPDAVSIFLNSATGCTVDRDGRPLGTGVQEADADAILAVMGRAPDRSAGWSLDIRTARHGAVTAARVRHVRRYTPAWEAGLRPGDRLVTINGRPVPGMRVRELAGWRLDVGDTLDVQVQRAGVDGLLGACGHKRHTEWPLVRGRVGKDGVGHVEIHAFAPRLPQLMDAELARLRTAGASSLVLDLRHNPGGDAEAALELADRFVPRGTPLAVSVDHDGTRRPRIARQAMTSAYDLPVTVRVNGQTASAAELFAGALQAAGRARVVGTRTFGKGAASVLTPGGTGPDDRDGTLQVRTYRLPGDVPVDGVGITPDEVVADDEWTAAERAAACAG